MGLMNIFRENNGDKITPFTMDEKIFFVKVFLQTKDIIPKDFGDIDGDDLTSIAGTPQYTLVMYLDLLYTITKNDTIRIKHTKEAAKLGIDLHDFSLSVNSLFKLADYYTSMRKLPEYARKEIQEIWLINTKSSNNSNFGTLKDACYWWADSIVEPLQMFDCLEKQVQENITDDSYMDKVTHQLSLNHSLVDSYLEVREAM